MKTALRLSGITLTVLFAVFAFSRVQWGTFLDALGALHPVWLALSAAALLSSMILRCMRWRVVSGLPWKDLPKVWEAACAGYLGIIYPARAGEVLRMLRLQQLTGVGGGLAIGGAVIDRILDGLSLCGMLLILIFAWGGGLEARQGLLGLAGLFVAAACLMAVFVARGHWFRTLFLRLAGLGKIGVRLNHWYEQCLDGLQVLRSPRHILLAVFCQVLVSLFDILACWFLINAFGWDLPFIANIVVLVYLTAALSLPSTPGYVGMYQAAALFALRPFGVSDSAAVAYGSVLQVLTLVLFIGAGIWAMFKQKARDQLAATDAA